MSRRRLHPLLWLWLLAALWAAACATGRAARHFAPASAVDAREALDAWAASRERAESLPASRLLYDARLSSGTVASVPGTLAVTYDGKTVLAASLTGPFGSRVAEYRDGTLRGEDRKAFVVDPEVLRAVLAGTWNGSMPSVKGREGGDFLLAWSAAEPRVSAVLDVTRKSLRSLELEGRAGRLVVDYGGEPAPWPGRITLRDETTGRGLALKLVAVEPMSRSASAGP